MTAPANLRGWGQGWPVNRSGDMATVRAARSGTSFTVHELIAPIIRYLIDETERRGYLLDHGHGDQNDDWSYANRPIRGKRTPSNHSWGLAVDIDATQFPMGSKKRLPQWIVDLWKAHGFDYGGDWKGRADPMHFEFNGWPSDARRIAAQVAGLIPSDPTSTPPPYTPPAPPTPPIAPEPEEAPMAAEILVVDMDHPRKGQVWEFFGDRTRRMVPQAGNRANLMVMAALAWGRRPIRIQNVQQRSMMDVLFERYRDATPAGDYDADKIPANRRG
jgi:hypothetical protein